MTADRNISSFQPNGKSSLFVKPHGAKFIFFLFTLSQSDICYCYVESYSRSSGPKPRSGCPRPKNTSYTHAFSRSLISQHLATGKKVQLS